MARERSVDRIVGLWSIVAGILAGFGLWVAYEVAPGIFENPRVGLIWDASSGALLVLGIFRVVASKF